MKENIICWPFEDENKASCGYFLISRHEIFFVWKLQFMARQLNWLQAHFPKIIGFRKAILHKLLNFPPSKIKFSCNFLFKKYR
jgi:hypothetical protein